MNTPAPASALVNDDDPRAAVWNMIYALWRFAALNAWVDLECSDHLRKEPLTVEELAQRCGAQAPFLVRLMKTMTSLGFVQATEPGIYVLTEVGRVLCADTVDSMRPGVLVMGEDASWGAMGDLAATIRTGTSPIEAAHGSHYDYMATRPELGEAFQEFMTTRSRTFGRALVTTVDFAGIQTVVDVGGGNGTILAAILKAHPNIRGTLVDLEPVIPGAREFLAAHDLADRTEAVAGDFFESLPAGADVYVAASIIHNWDDEDALCILRTLRAAMTGDSRVLLVDVLLPDDAQPHPGRFLDMRMLSLFGGGRERSRAEYLDLLRQAGLTATRVAALPTTPVSVIEAYPQA